MMKLILYLTVLFLPYGSVKAQENRKPLFNQKDFSDKKRVVILVEKIQVWYQVR
jgi:hypothetical protein